MTDWLLLLKIALGTVLLFDVMLLLRRPAEGAVVTTLPASEELRRKGVNMVLMPLVVTFILVLDLLQGNSPLPSLTLLARLIPAPWLGVCPPGVPLCGPEFCTISGNWHLGWTMPLNNFLSLSHWFGGIGQFPDYLLACLLLPCLYGAWRFALLNGLVGPLLASGLTSNPNEMPAIWCLFSVMLVLIGISPLIRSRVFPPAPPA